MAQAGRDENFVPTLLALSSVDGTTPIPLYANPTTHRLLVNLASGDGTVTDVSVVTANGFAGSVANSTTTPAITLETTITGIIKGDGTALLTAVAGSDYTDLAFKTIAVSGQTDVVADNASDTLTLVAGTGMTLTTSANSITFALTTDPSTYANKALSNLASVAINTALLPGVSDSIALGSGTKTWSDLFLGDAAVINFNNGNYTVTHSAGLLAFSGTIQPSANDGAALGAGTVSWSDLFLASGGVINFNNGDVTITHATNALAFAGASSGYTFDALVSPAANDGAALGTGTVSWADLFLASGAVINFDNSNVVLTHSAGILTMGTGEMRITTAGTNTASVITQGSTNTLANKTLSGANGNVLGAVTMTLGSDADGDTYYRSSNVLTRLAKGTAGQVLRMNSGATAPEWGSSNSSFTGTAEEDLTVGQPVGVSNIMASKIARATRVVSANTHGIANMAFTGLNNRCFAPIGGDKMVWISYGTDASDTLYAQVISVNRSTLTVSLGAAATVATAYTPGATNMPTACVCKLDTDKFIVIYLLDGSTTQIKYRIGTVSGTTITFGTEANGPLAGSTVATTGQFASDQLATDKGIFVFKAATTTNSKYVCFTASGTVATFGTGVTPGTNSQLNVTSSIKKIGTDKFVCVSMATSSSMYAQVCTVSGTTITAGTEAQISTVTMSSSIQFLYAISPATDVFVAKTQDGSADAVLVACTVSGTTITAGTPLTTTAGSNVGNGLVWSTDASTIWLGGGTSAQTLDKITLSGTTLTEVGVQGRVFTTVNTESGVYTDNGYATIFEVTASNIDTWIQGMSNNFVGVVQSTVSRGNTASVVVRGIDSNQTNLSPGNLYQAVSGAFTVVSTRATADQLDENQFIVKAISDTQIAI